MKKVLTILTAALLFLMLFGCDLGTSGSDPVNPVDPEVPSDPLAVGSITLILTDPGVVAEYNDGYSPRAVITGAASNGCTFATEVYFDETTVTVTVDNLLEGIWNIKVKVWDDLLESDNNQPVYDEEGVEIPGETSGKLEDVVALGYETVLIVYDENKNISLDTDLTVDLITQDGLNAILDAAVFDMGIALYDDSGVLLKTYYLPEDSDDYMPRAALTWGVYALMAYDEEIVLDVIEELDPDDAEDMAELEEVLSYVSLLSSSANMAATVLGILDSAEFWEDEITFVDMMNLLLDPDDEEADLDANDFLSIIVGMYQTVDMQVIGDYEFLYYDFVDLEMSGITSDYDGSASADLTVTPFYDSSLCTYAWYLNGEAIGTGVDFTLDPDAVDFADGVNYLSVHFMYGTVILGTDEVWFYTESSGDRELVDLTVFTDPVLRQTIENTNAVFIDEITSLRVRTPASSDLSGLETLIYLKKLELIYLQLTTASDVQPVITLLNLTPRLLTDLTIIEGAATNFSQAEGAIQAVMPGFSVDVY